MSKRDVMGLFEKIAKKAISDAAKAVADQNKKTEILEHKARGKRRNLSCIRRK